MQTHVADERAYFYPESDEEADVLAAVGRDLGDMLRGRWTHDAGDVEAIDLAEPTDPALIVEPARRGGCGGCGGCGSAEHDLAGLAVEAVLWFLVGIGLGWLIDRLGM